MDEFKNVLRNEIENLKKEGEKVQKKINKVTAGFNVHDISKLNDLSIELLNIKHTINYLYSIIGSL